MPLTRDFRETVRERARCEPRFREMLLESSIECLLGGEVNVAKIVLRDYIETTISYDDLGELTNTPPESLAFMFGKKGNPSATDLLKVIVHIQQHEGIQFEVKVVPAEVEDEYEDEGETEVVADVEAEAAATR